MDVPTPAVRRRPGCVVITVCGVLDRTAAATLRQMLFDPTVCDQPTIVVDLCDVTHLESTAIGGLVAARRWHQARDATLRLVVGSDNTASEIFATAPLDAIFDVRGSHGTRPSRG